jgi:hypothetical protein
MSAPKTVHGLFTTIRDAMRAKGVPFDFFYGPPQVPLAVGATRLVMLRDEGDAPGPATSQHRNPRMFSTRGSGLVVRIHAQSTLQGAQRHNHEDLADLIADQVRVELHKAVNAFKTTYRMGRMGFVANLDTPEGWAGVTYEIRFTVDRGEFDRAWTGEAAGEATGFTIANASPDAGGPGTGNLPSATTRLD